MTIFFIVLSAFLVICIRPVLKLLYLSVKILEIKKNELQSDLKELNSKDVC